MALQEKYGPQGLPFWRGDDEEGKSAVAPFIKERFSTEPIPALNYPT